MPRYAIFLVTMIIAAAAAAQSCNQPASDPVTMLDLPGRPFQAVPSADGCWIFVSLAGGTPGADGQKGVAVVARKNGVISLSHVVPTKDSPLGMTLTHDGKLLIGAMDGSIVFIDTARAISGKKDAVVDYLSDPKTSEGTAGAVYANVTTDDHWLFVSDESAERITVINLEWARSHRFHAKSIVGTVPVGFLPIAVTLSPDERLLYTTSESAAKEWGWPDDCSAENTDPAKGERFPQGAIVVVDAARAGSDPKSAVLAKAPAGCSPVRLALSPGGDTAYVTARNANAVEVFDTGKLITDPLHAMTGKVPVGSAPVGVIVVDRGRKVVATNSNRFAAGPNDHSTLTVIDARTLAVRGSVPTGAFPREMRLTADGQTLLLTNFASRTLQMMRVNALP